MWGGEERDRNRIKCIMGEVRGVVLCNTNIHTVFLEIIHCIFLLFFTGGGKYTKICSKMNRGDIALFSSATIKFIALSGCGDKCIYGSCQHLWLGREFWLSISLSNEFTGLCLECQNVFSIDQTLNLNNFVTS